MAVHEITVDELAERLDAGGVRLIDVREPDEYAQAHVPGAVLIPLATVPDQLDELVDELNRGSGELLVICRSGGRSMQACEFLASNGVVATNVAGGTMAWILAGREVEAGEASGDV